MIQTTEVSITYKGDGVQTSFPYPYPYRNSDDIVGYIINDVGYEKRITNNFKYDKVSNIYQYPLAGEPLAAPYSIKLIRETPQQQNADLPGKLPFSLIEKSLDWIIMILQEIGSRCNSLWHIRNDCKLSETNARNSASAAAESEENAANSKDMAKKWAMSPVSPDGVVDTDSPTGYTQSAKIWAALSKEYAGMNKFKLPIGYYDSVAEMKASETAIVGRPCLTLGYYEPNDGGGAVYVVRSKADSDTDDGGNILVLDNGNVAELLIDGPVNVKQFGVKGDGITDASTALQAAINASNHVIIPTGTYNITQTLTISKSLQLEGESTGSIIQLTASTDINLVELTGGSYHEFANITFTRSTKDTSAGVGIATNGGGWNAKLTNCTFTYLRIGVLLHGATGISINKCYFTVLGYGVLFEAQTPESYNTTTLIDIRYSTFQYCNPALKIENAQNTYAQLLNLLCLSCDFEANTQSLAFKNYSYNYTFINCWFENNTNAPDVSGGTWIGTMFQRTTDSDVIKPNATTLLNDGGNDRGITTSTINLRNATLSATSNGTLTVNNSPSIPLFISYNPNTGNISTNIRRNVTITKIDTGEYTIEMKNTQGKLSSIGWLKAITMVAFSYNYRPPSNENDGTNIFDALKATHYAIDVYGANRTDRGSYWSDTCALDTLYVATYSDVEKKTPVACGFTVLLFGYF